MDRACIDTVALDIELPAVEEAGEAVLYVYASSERTALVGTVGVNHAMAAACVSKENEMLVEDPEAYGGPIGLRDLVLWQDREPVPAYGVSHRGAASCPPEDGEFLGSHGLPNTDRLWGGAGWSGLLPSLTVGARFALTPTHRRSFAIWAWRKQSTK